VLRIDPESGELELVTARWGLVPHWWKDAKPPQSCFNARIEEAAAKPMWRDAMRRARCLIPAEGWYEWQQRTRPGSAKSYKQPYFIHRRDAALLAFAGLMSSRRSADGGEPLLSCAILTAPSSGNLAQVHPRMPVVLPEEMHAAWLAPAPDDGAKASELCQSGTATLELEHFPVSTSVNNGASDGTQLIEKIELD
jgi:putative SOS response-associated peptidase YedK